MKLESFIPKWWSNKVILQEIVMENKKILLLKLDKGYEIQKEGQQNLLGVDKSDNIIWVAGLPTEVYDSYYDMWFENGILFGRSSNSYIAEIDHYTGEILKKYLVK